MSGKGKSSREMTSILKGIIAGLVVCLLLLCMEALMLQKGNMQEAMLNPLLAASVFIAALVGCITAAQGGKDKRGIIGVLPGMILMLMILAGRWIMGNGSENMKFTFLLIACAAVPTVLIGVKRPKKRRR